MAVAKVSEVGPWRFQDPAEFDPSLTSSLRAMLKETPWKAKLNYSEGAALV